MSSLGLMAYHTGGGDLSPRIEFNAKYGTLTSVDRTTDGTGTIRIDISAANPVFAWDIGSLEIGWISFRSGMAPSFVTVPYGQPMPARPDRAHKAGFRSKVWDSRSDAKEFSTTAGATIGVLEALWDQLTDMPEAAAGKIPVIRFAKASAVRTGPNTNFAPSLSFVQWIDRDERVFGPRTVAAPGQPAIVPVAANNNQAAPPAWPAPAPLVVAPLAWPVAA